MSTDHATQQITLATHSSAYDQPEAKLILPNDVAPPSAHDNQINSSELIEQLTKSRKTYGIAEQFRAYRTYYEERTTYGIAEQFRAYQTTKSILTISHTVSQNISELIEQLTVLCYSIRRAEQLQILLYSSYIAKQLRAVRSRLEQKKAVRNSLEQEQLRRSFVEDQLRGTVSR
ncbi:hypothetical protein F511_25232 [Dorcoceras hygrometricum]|uniref:Uncharacterized protein n=1 Tax=Dorcoceras hygrometricum TaxID=472368 RepID=A0A2Z7AET6_9LAMI|nr:hypothetical protein F511_25232 [Dorcoceras hygrometricum]